ncbi:Ferrous iron transport protein B [hydrothermal vent metagenome]|uniref:Ferrous iron transport protein B n=1 Tax=hydrothermal vent metagenome TaxID=652676 RepID=A0A3B0R9K8_9ZZZZ
MSIKRIALVGAPNTGKTTLFNALTGGRAKTGNYPGVTVEKRTGSYTSQNATTYELIDLPGIYGLSGRSSDERVALQHLRGDIKSAGKPDLILAVLDAARLQTHLHSVLQFRELGLPMVLVLNMMDLAKRDGVEIDLAKLETELGFPVIGVTAPRQSGRAALENNWDQLLKTAKTPPTAKNSSLPALQKQARSITKKVMNQSSHTQDMTRRIDRITMHPVFGPLLLVSLMFFIFQAVYTWSQIPMDAIEAAVVWLQGIARSLRPSWLASLLGDGVIAGVGSILVFLPQIVILFGFILLLEASGYMARAAFLVDGLMSKIGLNGRALIPLLSSFACAIPGIMAARSIESERDRLTTIMIAPLMTCSARLPVYALIIGAFIPVQKVGIFNLQGLVLFALYITGILFAILIAFILRRTLTKGPPQHLLLELPGYMVPKMKDFGIALYGRAWAFVRKAGTVIFATSVILWFLTSYPKGGNGIRDSFAGTIGAWIEPIFRPIGFSLETVIALVPGMAAREVVVAAMGTVYAVQGNEQEVQQGLASLLQNAWSLPSALAFLAWYVFAPQCFATLATVRRETNSLGLTLFLTGYLFALAWIAAFVTFQVSTVILR